MKTFEYKVLVEANEEAFNALGQEGWELYWAVQGVDKFAGFYFKRETSPPKEAPKQKTVAKK